MAPKPPTTTTGPKKGLKLRRALKSAARLPSRAIPTRSLSGLNLGRGGLGRRTALTPLPSEQAFVYLRIKVISCTALVAKDRNGYSDPFVVVSVLNTRHQTPVAKRTVNPVWEGKNGGEATWDFPIWLSLADQLGAVELVVWDKDMVGKDYLGESAILLDEWFGREGEGERAFGWDDEANVPFTLPLVSTRAGTPVTGSVQVKLGFVSPPNTSNVMEFDEIFTELIRRSRPSLVSAPPTEGVGTIRSHQSGAVFQDDGGLSSDDSDDEDDGEGDHHHDDSGREGVSAFLAPPGGMSAQYEGGRSTPSTPTTPLSEIYKPPGPPHLTIQPSSPATPTQGPDTKTPTASPLSSTPTSTAPGTPNMGAPSPTLPAKKKKLFPIPLPRRISGLGSSSSNSSVGMMSSSSSGALSTPSSNLPPATPVVDPTTGELVPGTPAPALASPGIGAEEEGKKEKKGKRFRKSWGAGSPALSPSPVAQESGESGGSGHESRSPSGSGSDNVRAEGVKKGRKKKVEYSLDAGNDIVGIVMLEIQSAEDLPRLKNMTRTGWDMDPFVVISFGKKVFRTRVIRHSRNPVWDEKLLFHVRRYETSFKVQLTILDWDKLSSNDHIGDASFDVAKLIEQAPQKDPVMGLYDKSENGEHDMVEFKLKLDGGAGGVWEAKHNPAINIRAKYQPYDALRQRFWRQYLKQYDTDDTGTISHLELTSMLDSLNSTLTRSTIRSFFTRNEKVPHRDELTVEEVIHCLETELGRPDSEKRRVDEEEGEGVDTSVNATPALGGGGAKLDLDNLDFSGPPHVGADSGNVKADPPGPYTTEPAEIPLVEVAAPTGGAGVTAPVKLGEQSRQGSYSEYSESDDAEDGGLSSGSAAVASGPEVVDTTTGKTKKYRFRRKAKGKKGKDKESSGSGSGDASEESIERVINVRNCPLCHRPRMNSKAEMDIITHMAVCASQDWEKVDRIVVGNFVTASQAQRKWYTKIISKVSSGDYKLGANSANIIVQNRMTGQLEEEKMQVYVRLGIRLLYKGATSRMEGGRARRLLKSLSIKQGIKYDAPESALDIPTFIEFHGLNVNEIQDPIDSFKSFNEFFYRKLKPSARPIDKPDDPYRMVSAADCRLMTFATVDEATRLWIKGREFTVARLLGDSYKGQAERYAGGALAIFRLAPQDYHRFHSPVEGTIGPMTYIAGEYYTVNPQAIRTSLDVYGENARKIVPIDSPHFGRVMAVCIGAMMVGSIKTTVQEGDYVHRGQEFGYFAFGGSTIVILFEKGALEWDEDLLINGRASLETLVRVGMGIGTGRRGHVHAD
ncbi:phosphatidylserine decarboxylase-domain-containing protein [Collybia nuda]|uniref:Phosphatidylserine decarboxylase proenzyme 2 n=1 Tax=Collybia nuda TaxID=64659 RepID=A0A9P6CGV4_9AGAR|nr:phosphatidylserine decarboxylase-domain-containing protein [Collybia nuda]